MFDGNGPKEMVGVEPLPKAFQNATIVDRLEQQKNQSLDALRQRRGQQKGEDKIYIIKARRKSCFLMSADVS